MSFYNKKCIGCGATIQTSDASKPGFVPDNVLNSGDERLICQRCHKIKNYGKFTNSQITDEEFRKTISAISKEKALVVYVIDIFDFEGSLIEDLNDLVGNNPILVVANKKDVIPHAVKDLKLRNKIKSYIDANGIRNVQDLIVTSAAKIQNIDKLVDKIVDNMVSSKAYIVGTTNVGKSTLINAVIKKYSDLNIDLVTTSKYPGTTLDVIEIPLDESHKLLDTPGVVNRHQITHVVDEKTLSKILPKKEVKQRVYQLNDKQTLFIEKLAAMSFVKGERSAFACFFSNDLEIHRSKYENKDDIWTNPQVLKYGTDLPRKLVTLTMPMHGKHDIVISGLGWIRVESRGQEIEMEIPQNVRIFVREALV